MTSCRAVSLTSLGFCLLVATAAHAQLTQVNVMPGAPHMPRTAPHPARPAVGTLVWGNANGGGAGALGSSYTWSFAPNANVQVVDDGNLSGIVSDPKFIVEEVTFNLLNFSTNETILATLTAVDGFSNTFSDSVFIQIIDPTDPSSVPQTAGLQIDVNIAIENGLRRLYLQQLPSGAWPGFNPCAEGGFALWCFGNKGHKPTTPIASDDDIYAEFVQRGLDQLFANLVVAGTVAANADVVRGAVANGVSDLNGNGRSIRPCMGTSDNYQVAISTAAIIAALSPARLVTVGPFAGDSYKTVVEDLIDFIGTQQNSAPPSGPRGGWNYTGPSVRSDQSINSWMFVTLEGAEATNYNIPVPDWIKQEAEYCLVFHQPNAAGPQWFGYDSNSPLITWPTNQGRSTTSAGLSGLALVETESIVPVGAVIAAAPAPLNTIAAKRQAAIDWLGAGWHEDSIGGLGEGNRGNYYTMWTVARTLRITADALNIAKVPLVNGAVTFDWEFGEETGNPGVVPGFGLAPNVAGPPREGYFNWLVRNQDNTNANLYLRGQWDDSTFIAASGGPSMETSLGTLVLIPEVFASSDCAAITDVEVLCDLTDPTGTTFVVNMTVTNDSGVPVTNIVIPPTSTVPGAPVVASPNVFPQSPPLANGASATVTFVITNGTGGTQACFRLGLLDSNFEDCCGTEFCVDLPDCGCVQVSNASVVCDPLNPGQYTYQFTLTNVSPFTLENAFLLGALPAGVSFAPSAFSFSPVPPGGSVTLSTQVVGGVPGQVLCFQISVHDATLQDCCAIDRCITLPPCGPTPCVSNFVCDVVNGQVVLTWTLSGHDCCQSLSVTTAGGTTFPVPPGTTTFTVPGVCQPGEYCLQCSNQGTPPTVLCCTVDPEDCSDPCVDGVMCMFQGSNLVLTWTPPPAPSDCCGEMQISLNGMTIAFVAASDGMYVVPNCKAGTYCITCIDSVGIPGNTHCCTVDFACPILSGPVVVSTPVLTAAVGVAYLYDVDGYLPGLEAGSLDYQLPLAPQGAAIDPDTGQIQWTPTGVQTGNRPFRVIVTAPGGTTVQDWVVSVGVTAIGLPQFVRGDCNPSGAVDIADAVRMLSLLFAGGGAAACDDACDVNDSGNLDISDPIYLLGYLFANGSNPPEPFVEGCGTDPGEEDTLGCSADMPCP
ncbi:MAG: putative Ig domain-containing protein [Planctomycetota bacterium]